MDLFKFSGDTATDPKYGQYINGATRTMWVERYSELGEFEIVAPLSSDLRRFLPLGTVISHVNTNETMMVENHEVTENLDEDSEVKITGRSLAGFLENRIIGVNAARSSSAIPSELTLASDVTWDQIVTLINAYISTPSVDPDDEVPLVIASTLLTGTGTTEERTLTKGDEVIKPVFEWLNIDDLGIRSVRAQDSVFIQLEIYKGEDKSKDVIFSWTGEDLSGNSYLFTNRKIKNSALVAGKWVWTVVDTAGYTGYDRRMMYVDAEDIDRQLNAMPSGGALSTIVSRMQTRGRQKLRKQKSLSITNAEISNLSRYEYRNDYRVGDLVTIEGDFNQQEIKRVTEYAEVEDENGYSGHPTLDTPFPEE